MAAHRSTLKSQNEPFTILCFGDGNTWGKCDEGTATRLGIAQRWPGVLRTELGSAFHVIEDGLPDRLSVWGDALLGDVNGEHHLKLALARDHPLDLVILMMGSSELRSRLRLDADTIAAGIEHLAQTVLASEPWPGAGSPRLVILSPPHYVESDATNDKFDGARQKSLLLAAALREASERIPCLYFETASAVERSLSQGSDLGTTAHKTLGTAMAAYVHQILAPEGDKELWEGPNSMR